MSLTAAAVLALAALYLALALAGIFRSGASSVRRAALLAGRVVMLALLAAAFFRPGLTLQRLAGAGGAPLALIDNSRSMEMFPAESLWNALVQPAAEQAHAALMLFGDSLRDLAPGRSPGLTDRRSFLPTAAGTDSRLAGAQRVLLVTDGNWSNARIPPGFLADKEVYYLRLETAGQRPWLTVEALDERVETVTGHDTTVRVLLSGLAAGHSDVMVACMRQQKALARVTRRVGPGFFKDTVTLPLRSSGPGSALCRVLARSDTLAASCHVLHTVMPAELRAGVRCATPSLDSRFLGRALRRTGGWRMAGADSGTAGPHLLVLFDWSEADQAAVDRMAPGGVALLAGCLPCRADSVSPGGPCRLTIGRGQDLVRRQLPFTSVPPPQAVLTCGTGAPEGRTLIAIECRSGPGADTLPLLAMTTLRGRPAMLLAARGFWRWDFRTQLLEEARAVEHPFCRYVLAQARERIAANLSDNLLAYPRVSAPSEGAEVPMAVMLPAGGAWTQPAELRFGLRSAAGDTVYDTTLTLASLAAPGAEVVVPPCAEGLYAYEVRLRRQGERSLTYADTLRVGPDRTEYAVAGQNTTLLEPMARPAECRTPAELAALLTAPAAEQRRTVTATLRVEHTWLLLAALAALFVLEWALRRVWMLD